MGFDKHFNQDHCYSDAVEVAMNVEIVDESVSQGLNESSDKTQSLLLNVPEDHTIIYEDDESYEFINKDAQETNYVSIENCSEHSNLSLLEDEMLVKPGDVFSSHEDFIQYVNDNAKRWCFYYKCSDSRKNATYTYNCVYLRNKENYKKKGLRKRHNNLKTDCPCKIKLRYLDEHKLIAVYVCNHHDHPLSEGEFYKLQHGRRLPQNIKEDVMDLLFLKVDVSKIRKFVLMETGLDMSRAFFFRIERILNSKKITRNFTEENLQRLLDKINALDGSDDMIRVTKRNVDPNRIVRKGPVKRRLNLSVQEDAPSQVNTKKIKQESMSASTSSNEQQSFPEPADDATKVAGIKCEAEENPWTSFASEIQESLKQDPEATVVYTDESDPNNSYIIQENGDDNYVIYHNYVEGTDQVEHQVIEEPEQFHQQEVLVEAGEVHSTFEDVDNSEQINEATEVNYETVPAEESVVIDHESENTDVVYVPENDSGCMRDIGVQTHSVKPGHAYVPLFDVYMKNGNVTGFVLNDRPSKKVNNSEKSEIAVQTEDDVLESSHQTVEAIDGDCSSDEDPNVTFTKHEYIHKYNLDQYMVQPNFPKYIETLALKTDRDVLNMLTNIYKEKAMFKLTTIQRGKEGNQTIWYVKNSSRKRIPVTEEDKKRQEEREKKMSDIIVLREKVRSLKKRNVKLATRNNYLEQITDFLCNDGTGKIEIVNKLLE